MVASKLLAKGVRVLAHDPFFAAGEELALPRTSEKLRIAPLEDLCETADVLAQLHNIPLYDKTAAMAGKPVENLTTITNRDPHDAD
jgi:hypothetical protein